MTSSTVNSNTDFYKYDHENIRIAKGNGTATTTYPNMYYNTDGTTVTKHIFDPITGTLLATIEGDGTATSTQYIHTDHLGGTNVVTDESGEVVEATDYYPFGEERINTGTYTEQRKFTGHEFDSDTDLTYAKQRYYDQDVGKFISQDSAFLSVGTSKLADILKMEKGNGGEDNNKDENERRLKALQQYLSNPQQMNSYSYANNNPINLTDPEGEIGFIPVVYGIIAAYNYAQSVVDAINFNTVVLQHPEQFSEEEINTVGHKVLIDIYSFGIARFATSVENKALDLMSATVDLIENYTGDSDATNLQQNNTTDTFESKKVYQNNTKKQK